MAESPSIAEYYLQILLLMRLDGTAHSVRVPHAAGTVPLPLVAVAVLITGVAVSIATKPANVFAQSGASYADDRAAIEDLQARYLFALDFHDPDLYVSTFTEDGVLDYGSGEVKGRHAIKEVIAQMPNPKRVAGKRAGAARHNISNIVIRVEGNRASGRSYWFHYSNDNPERRGVLTGLATTRTSWLRSAASGSLPSGRSITRAVMSGPQGRENPAW